MEPLTDDGVEETEVPRENSDNELQKLSRTKAGKLRLQSRHEPAL